MFAPFLDTGMHSEMYTHVAKAAGNNFIIGSITFNKVPIAHYKVLTLLRHKIPQLVKSK